MSYAPLLFSVLGALPYLGFPVLRVLSIWHLLAMVVGFGAVANISLAGAFGYVAMGWFVKEVLGNTIGQPIAKFGRRLTEQVAGVDLALNRTELANVVQSGLETRIASSAPLQPPNLRVASEPVDAHPSASHVAELPLSNPAPDISTPVAHWVRGIPQMIRLALIFLGMIVLFLLIALLMRPIRLSLLGWYTALPWLVRQIFDLGWIGVLSLVFAGFLAPLEALGWWSGWYGDEVETHLPIALSPEQDLSGDSPLERRGHRPSRYVVYLDGVSQSGEAYTPDVVEFIDALQSVLPQDMVLVQGLMLYSVLNKPLNQDRPLAGLWRLADQIRWKNPTALLGMMVNLRNTLIVAVSADKRYGPIYNQGIAQVLYNGLIQQGYQPGERLPITLIGYSGGGQMAIASAPYLKRVLGADIDVISLGGVMSANCDLLKLGHLYHLTGEKDSITKLGPMLFPGRWKLFPLSYWNRALRKGKISLIPLGPMGHQVPGGIMDPDARLPNGQSFLQHTITLILSILTGQFLVATPPRSKQISNYAHYKQAGFNDYSYYPLDQTVDPQWYRPIAPWMGRLILPQPSERKQVRGVWFEVHHAARGYGSWVGKRVMLRWVDHLTVKQMVRAVTQDVHFSVDAEYSSLYGGSIHPDRINHWQQVGPLESLAGSHPVDDLTVMLEGEVQVDARDALTGQFPVLSISHQPVEITGRYYGVVRFDAPIADTDRIQVRHFNPVSRQFDGWVETVRLPPMMMAQCYGSYPSTTKNLERSPSTQLGMV